MTPRENLLSLFRRQSFERIPVEMKLCPSLQKKFNEKYGDDALLHEVFDFPMRWVGVPGKEEWGQRDWSVYYPDGYKEGTWIDNWGVGHEPGSAAAVHMTHMLHPMENLDSLEEFQAYPFPDYETIPIAELARPQVEEIHKQGYAAMTTMACTIWEIAWYLRSMEQLMMDMMEEADEATWLLDKVTSIACYRASQYASSGLDWLHLGDDVGMQSRLMFSVEFYREWIKPRLKQVIDAARAQKPDIIITYHSCGYVLPVIEDLIEVGVDVLNPVQPECMDFAEIHEKYGDRLSFWGTIGTQTTMPFGSPEDVRKEVLRNLEIAGDKGGLLCAPTHLLEPEVPWENIEAYVAACREFCTAGC